MLKGVGAKGGSLRQFIGGATAGRVYYDAAQLRVDTWSQFKQDTARLETAALRGADLTDLRHAIAGALQILEHLESYWAFPGKHACKELQRLFEEGAYGALTRLASRLVRLLVSDSYRSREASHQHIHDLHALEAPGEQSDLGSTEKPVVQPYFEVLVVDDVSVQDEADVRRRLLEMRRPEDEFVYDVVVVSSFQDALIAVLFNHNIQSVVVRYNFPFRSTHRIELLEQYLAMVDPIHLVDQDQHDSSMELGRAIRSVRPELDLFLVTDVPVEDVAGELSHEFRRVFYRQEDYMELHLSILRGIRERYETPFFTALREYSQKPTGVFHALPISRGKSITKSHWIRDVGDFYGTNIFLAETSATGGGLDSLLQPHGPLKRAQEMAARAFGARKSCFVTNGTSTANKIVMQALVRPGDIVLVSRDCHKSHHYALMLAGAYPVYLDAYPLPEYSMYGAVPLASIKRQLLALRRDGKLGHVRMLLLTNSTFDGVVYNPERVMEEVLAIKPDMVFAWDEAWFAFAHFTPTYRRRTAMEAAARLRERYRSAEYREQYAAWRADFEKKDIHDDETWINNPVMPDPERVRVRVYATQSTHKTLTSFRQGSMIHIYDQDFERDASDAFHEAYMTHTSTSPNYQILALLDAGRRQVELEGYEMVQHSVELAMTLRERLQTHPHIHKYFRLLQAKHLIPSEFRQSGLEGFYTPDKGWTRMEEAWRSDEFALDPTRVTIHIGRTGIDGDTFKNQLMDNHQIQINKTSRNTLLFMLNIGTTRGAIAYLIEVFSKVAQELEAHLEDQSSVERRAFEAKVTSLTQDLPPLPNFSRFHSLFRPDPNGNTSEGDLRKAFFLSYDDAACEYLKLDGSIARELASGREVVSATFVIPYPPGFPILVPGQVISHEILAFLKALDVKEIHGYRPEYGLRVFTEQALAALKRPVKTLRSENKPSSERPTLSLGPATTRVLEESDGMKKLRGISDIRRYFHRNEVPMYFVSATNFNLLGIDEWVHNFKFINYIDCFDGNHPNVIVPSSAPHRTFTSIEEINNYLLEHKDVVDYVKKRGPGKALFLFFDEHTEEICRELGLEIAFPSAKLRQEVDDKVSATRIANRAGVPCVPNVLSKVDSYETLRRVAQHLGQDLVVQTAFGDSGHTTFFISNEDDFRKHAEEIIREPEVKVMKRIRCRGSAIEACVTRAGTIVGPLMTELIGFKELTPYKGGWCGNEVFAEAFSREIRDNARRATIAFGDELKRMGYRGYFELDFLTDLDTGEVYLGEVNPRITGASSMTNLAAFAHADAPLFLFHLLEFSDAEFELDVDALNARWADPDNIDSWGQLVLKYTGDDVRVVTSAPRSGIWRRNGQTHLDFVRVQTHRRTVQNESEAFFLRITKEGDYLYHGADLGILVTPGRLMDENYELTDRARAWIAGIHDQYKSVPLSETDTASAERVAEVGAFKIL